jgi:membrane protein YqaA with SNARE-associated domain
MRRHHDDNMNRGVYGYLWWSGLKIILIYLLTIVPLILLLKKYVDPAPFFNFMVDHLSDPFMFIVFLMSESFLWMIPPDLFVIWTTKFSSPFFVLTILGLLSYAGGIISYYIGHWLYSRPRIKAYTERALEKYIKLVRRWGGAFIIIAALFPFSPYSMVVMAVSMLKYPFKQYLFFSISRILRFIIQGVLYLNILKLDSFFF